jgi:putative lipoprotein
MSNEFSQVRIKAIAMGRITRTAVQVLATVALLVVWSLGACGKPAPGAAVSGTVSYVQPTEAAPGTVVIVQIQDISAADAPAIVGEQSISNPGPVPVPFEVMYDPATIDDSHSYVVHARVEDGSGNLLYTTMQNYAVITQGHPTRSVNVILEMVGGGTTPQ